jgi:ASC-1-like (ASCH) protein
MKHLMKLLEDPFIKIASGEKTIEIRLFDEKRQQLNVGDIIEFSKLPQLEDKVQVKITALLRYSSFQDLIHDFNMGYYGYPEDYPINDFLNSIYKIYSPEQEKKYGVLGIKITLLKNY